MWTLEILVLAGVTFFVAGLVKGVVGLGLPTVTLAVFTATIGLQPAMGLLLVPSFVTNLWQGVVGGSLLQLLRRLGWLLIMVCAGTWMGVHVLTLAETGWLSATFGGLLVAYAATGLIRPFVPDLRPQESWLSPMTGLVNGILTGMTGSFVVPGVLYLQALRLQKDELVQAMGILFTVSTLVLGLAMGERRLISWDLALLSCLGVVPALVGMVAGQVVRQRMSEERFRKILFTTLLVLGVYIIYRSLVGLA
ncbi:MAG: sulfite exporter TauE/SafE family protein [Hyphomicrobiaceae bacterium]